MRSPENYLGKPVRSLQTMLRQISSQDTRIVPVTPDGIYGNQTTAAVRSFQYAYHLPVTGIVDPGTWAVISEVFHRAIPALHSPALEPIWNAGQQILPGQFNYHLYPVQGQFIALASFIDDLTPATPTGRNDPATVENLKIIQRMGELRQTGILDSRTLHFINGAYRTLIADGFQK